MHTKRFYMHPVSVAMVAGLIWGCTSTALSADISGVIGIPLPSIAARAETPRIPSVSPSPATQRAVDEYKAMDATASFTFNGAHVDSFAASPKERVPEYALAVLRQLGLSTSAEPIRKLLTPARGQRLGRDLDATDQALPFVDEPRGETPSSPAEKDGIDTSPGHAVPPQEVRIQPSLEPDKMVDWERRDPRTSALEQRAARTIVTSFLSRHAELFGIDPRSIGETLRLQEYRESPYFRNLIFDQFLGEDKVLYGRTMIHLDRNWNVIGVSRMLVTPEKVQMQTASPAGGSRIDLNTATKTAKGAPPEKECLAKESRVIRAERAVDIIRGLRVYDVEVASVDGDCHWRTIVDTADGRVLNVSDLVDRAATDAKVNRWRFPSGDLYKPVQIISPNQYTRDDQRLEHDFFYMMNDHRCEGAAETSCGDTGFATNWCSNAYGTNNGNSFIRATRRSDRDFSSYYPGGTSEAFAETNAYYWARQFVQWLKPSLDSLGVLPNTASDYPRVLMITDTCRSRSAYSSSLSVTTEGNRGEDIGVIRLAHRNPTGASFDNAACEGGGCFDNPSNVHHEMNHFFLQRYYGVGSDLDCGGANQLRFIHEGTLGTAVPQALWHSYYGVGYTPSATSKLYFSDSEIGQVHTTDSNRMTVGEYLCAGTDSPYTAGRVVGQALWEFYHGINVTGSNQSSTWRPNTDTDFNTLVYWAADLTAGSTYKDRYEYANRIMEILDKYSNWTPEAKRDYCGIFEHHGLRDYINPEYCH
jgi:hypothetical protein